MRTFVLLLVFVMPALGACSAASAQTTPVIGKPVCAHYDDAAKPAAHAASATAAPTAATTTVTASTGAVPASNASAVGAMQPKSGGTDGFGHARSGPRWQTFLPGMFK